MSYFFQGKIGKDILTFMGIKKQTNRHMGFRNIKNLRFFFDNHVKSSTNDCPFKNCMLFSILVLLKKIADNVCFDLSIG